MIAGGAARVIERGEIGVRRRKGVTAVPHVRRTPERLSAFSDGVFAVLITVLVLELRPPELPTLQALLSLWPTWLRYAVSYFFIAIVWANHHHLLHYASEPTPRLIWFNFAHLFSVSLLPLSTAWMAVSRLAPQPVAFYAAVFFLVKRDLHGVDLGTHRARSRQTVLAEGAQGHAFPVHCHALHFRRCRARCAEISADRPWNVLRLPDPLFEAGSAWSRDVANAGVLAKAGTRTPRLPMLAHRQLPAFQDYKGLWLWPRLKAAATGVGERSWLPTSFS